MRTDCHNITRKSIKRKENKLRQILDKMKSLSDIKQLLKEIKDESIRYRDQNKKKWYRIGKYLLNRNKLVMYKETQIAARRTYQYYLKIKGDWDGLSPRQLSKMKKSKFLDLLKGREEIEREILLTISTLNQDHVTEDHVDGRHVIKNTHMEEDHVVGQHVTWNFNSEDHVDGRHVTENSLEIWDPQGNLTKLIDKVMR